MPPSFWAVLPLTHMYTIISVCAATLKARERWTGSQKCSGGPLVENEDSTVQSPDTTFSADAEPALLQKVLGLRPDSPGAQRLERLRLGAACESPSSGSASESTLQLVVCWDETAVCERTQPGHDQPSMEPTPSPQFQCRLTAKDSCKGNDLRS